MTGVPDILLEIAAQRRRRLGVDGSSPPPTSRSSALDVGSHPFLAALSAHGTSVVAEVKLGSPRLGDLRGRIDPEHQARLYAEAGASALSVVVEPDYFFGSYELLTRCKEVSGLPALAKDFVVAAGQLESAARAGADAVLLIAALHGAEELTALAGAARERGLAPLVETHTKADLALLADGSWELVGVNNRDLRTFEVDVSRSERLRPRLPGGCLAVAESGLSTRREIERLEAAGFDAFLIGEALLTAADPVARLRELAGHGGEDGG